LHKVVTICFANKPNIEQRSWYVNSGLPLQIWYEAFSVTVLLEYLLSIVLMLCSGTTASKSCSGGSVILPSTIFICHCSSLDQSANEMEK
jgi:hypothetical protein